MADQPRESLKEAQAERLITLRVEIARLAADLGNGLAVGRALRAALALLDKAWEPTIAEKRMRGTP
jgi:hypothetical protein